MAASPRLVSTDFTLAWDGVQTFVPRGTIVDIPPGSALETAYASGNLVSLAKAQQGADDVPADTPDTSDAGGGSDS